MGVTDLEPLVDVLRREWGADDVRIVRATPLSAGASRLTSLLDLVADDGPVVPLVLQRERPGTVGGSFHVEAQVLRTAHAGGVPVPRLVAVDASGEVLGAPFLLTERVDGETIPRRIVRDPALAPARERFAADCGRILAGIHALPLADVPGLPRRDEVQELVGHLDTALVPSPAFEIALRWLEENRPPAAPEPVVVHGDFRNGNLIVGPDGVRAVLDWELAHAGDPMEDLGWLCVRAWRFGERLPVGGLGTREQLFEAYVDAGGRPVDPDVVFWWEVLGTLKWGLICSLQARAHLDGHSRSVELALIGRRVCENEYDLLRMLP